ncbi:MAG: 2-phosphosulfolactate phosphatase [Tenuifilum sp.]|jgi:2-phosphosulfolactate phosphatase|uniref:2-phosphosulfolactate phosphatase n=1 Tax=Tenuifilum sp. TaxID=2760880 RepID=UPI0024AC2AA7|nr:2-phosphosulfolactate phosphatase [Tenuifilum sp.]MDI3527565.1 2-phosphosulfolactate phosphatase [Tenuifilum sp.]
MNQVEVAFSPTIFNHYDIDNKIVVVADILRATSVICTMFKNGVTEIIPVRNIEEARAYKEKGYLVVAERNGQKLDFADFGNSPFYFTPETIGGKIVVYSTTNGTNAITMGKDANQVIIGSFLNISSVINYLVDKSHDVLIMCAGWKGKFSLEDALFAGALSNALISTNKFSTICDSANASMDLWNLAKDDLANYLEKVAQRHRLKKMGLDDVIGYCFTPDVTDVLPVLVGDRLKAISPK